MHWLVLKFAVLVVIPGVRWLVAVAGRVYSWIPSASFRRVYAVLCAIVAGIGACALVVGWAISSDVREQLLKPASDFCLHIPSTAILTLGCLLIGVVSLVGFAIWGALPQRDVPYQPRAAAWNIVRPLKYVGVAALLLALAVIGQDFELRWRLQQLRSKSLELADAVKPAAIPEGGNAAVHYMRAAELIDDIVVWDEETFGDFRFARERKEMTADDKAEMARKLRPVVDEFLLAAEIKNCRFPDEYQAFSPWFDGNVDFRHQTAWGYVSWFAEYMAEQQDPQTAVTYLRATQRMIEHLYADQRKMSANDYMWQLRKLRNTIAAVVTKSKELPEKELRALISSPLAIDAISDNCTKWSTAVVGVKLADAHTVRVRDGGSWIAAGDDSKSKTMPDWLSFAAGRFVGCRDDLAAFDARHRIMGDSVDPPGGQSADNDEPFPRGHFLGAFRDFADGRHWIVAAEGHRRLANVAIAAGLFREEHDAWPTTPADVAPYLAPVDLLVPSTDDEFQFKQIQGGLIVFEPVLAEFVDSFDDSRDWWIEARGLFGQVHVLYPWRCVPAVGLRRGIELRIRTIAAA